MYAKAYSGINMLYPAINAKIGPTDAAAQVRSNHICSNHISLLHSGSHEAGLVIR